MTANPFLDDPNTPRGTMSTDEIKSQMHRFVEFINAPTAALAEDLVDADAAFHVPYREEPLKGPGGYTETLNFIRSAFPDIEWELLEMVVEGDTAAARFVVRGTHGGDFLGVPASGRRVEYTAMNFYRWRGGRIYAEFAQPDMMGLMTQIDPRS